MELIAELATSHGGNVDLACEMVQAAADSGAHTVKIQSYTLAKLNPADPQAAWLTQAYLDEAAHERIIKACADAKVQFLSTPFDFEALLMLMRLGQHRMKVASSQPMWNVLQPSGAVFLKSWAWGRKLPGFQYIDRVEAHLTAIPLYPTPLEAVIGAPLLQGWSDHTISTAVCKHMLSMGAKIIEAHFSIPGKGRNCAWDKTPAHFRELRDWADTVQTMTTGVSTQFRDRWTA